MSERIDLLCGDCFFYTNEEMRGNTPLGGGHMAGECHGHPPVAVQGWPILKPNNVGCRLWKKGGVLKAIISPPEPTDPPIKEEALTKEEPCPSTNTSVPPADQDLIDSLKPMAASGQRSRADVEKELRESPAGLDSLSVGPSTTTNPTKKKQ